MCLDTISKQPFKHNGVGYQAVKCFDEGLAPLCQWSFYSAFNGRKHIPVSHWEKDKAKGSIEISDWTRYPKGFHICLDLEECKQLCEDLGYKNYQIHKVLFKEVIAHGFQDALKNDNGRLVKIDVKVVVAKKRCVTKQILITAS